MRKKRKQTRGRKALTDANRENWRISSDAELNWPGSNYFPGAHRLESYSSVVASHPLVGRIVECGLREMVISRGRSGYVALYRYDAESDQVLILAVRHQRELE